jgi:DNA polymerase-3 subunit delta
VDEKGLQVDCRLPSKTVGKRTEPDENRLLQWLSRRAKHEHQVELESAAARLLWELVGPELGLVDQELAKLALFTGNGGKVTVQLVQDVVGGWRAKSIWDTIEAAAGGDAAEALAQLDRALQSGEHPQALFGQIAWSLRRFTVATRIYQRAERQGARISLQQALSQAGFRPWPADLAKAEKQIIQLGRDRAGRMLRWLLETDMAMKGSHSRPDRARFLLEMLFLRQANRTSSAGRA